MSYKVLIFGRSMLRFIDISSLDCKNAEITASNYPDDKTKLQTIFEYDLVVTDLNTFNYRDYQQNDERIFRKSLIRALKNGIHICFLHYSEGENSTNSLGKKISFHNGISVTKRADSILDGNIKLNIFRKYLTTWGASHLYFQPDNPDTYDDIIYENSEELLGFSIKESNGYYIYLPFQPNPGDKIKNTLGFNVLIDTLLNYRTKKESDIPEWAEKSYFQEEEVINSRIIKLQEELKKEKEKLETFTFAKALLTAREYDLENKIPRFFRDHLGIDTERDETYNEDFWILNSQGEKEIICEIKSILKGFKKGLIFQLYNHRDSNNLDETFPGLLIVNHHLQAGSWKDKDRPIDKQDYEVASQYNVLILRVEDIVNLWDGIRNNQIDINLLEKFRTTFGWLKVDRDYNIRLFS